MTKEERKRIKELKRLLRIEDKRHVKLSRREEKLQKSLKAVKGEFAAHMRRFRKLQNEVEKIQWGNQPTGTATSLLERVHELRLAGLGLTEAVAKAREEALKKAEVQSA